jgi:hypothetical protein
MNSPKIIKDEPDVCIHKPSLKCKGTGHNYKGKISKYMSNTNAQNEMNKNTIIKQIDPTAEFHLATPEICEIDKNNEINKKAIKKCKNGQNGFNEDNKLLIMKDGGMNLVEFVEKYSKLENTTKTQNQMEKFWIECYRLIRGIEDFSYKDFLHCDLKPENIVYNEKENRLNFINFGASITKSEIKDKSLDNEYNGHLSWAHPLEMHFYNKSKFKDFFLQKEEEKIEYFDDLYENFNENNDNNEHTDLIETLNELFRNLKSNEPFKNAYMKNYERFLLDEYYVNKHNYTRKYEEFLRHSTNKIDVYGLGVSLMCVLVNTRHLIDDKFFTELFVIFYGMINPYLLERYRPDNLLEDYGYMLENTGILQKHNMHFEDNMLIDLNTPEIDTPEINIPEKPINLKNKNLIGMDINRTKKKVSKYITEDKDNLVFILNNDVVLTNKYNVRLVIKDSRVYACRNANGSINPINVIKDKMYFKLANLGLTVNYAYIDITHINEILNNTKQVYEFIRTDKELPSVVTYILMHPEELPPEMTREEREEEYTFISRSHCQEEQGGYVYEVSHDPTFETMKNINKIFHKINISRIKKQLLSEPKSQKTRKIHSLPQTKKELAKTTRKKTRKIHSLPIKSKQKTPKSKTKMSVK